MEKPLLRFAATNVPPFHVWKIENNKSVTTGANTFLFKMMCETFGKNFRLEILHAKEDQMGYEQSPGNWTGVVGQLVRNEADIYTGFYIVVPDLFPFLEYSTSYGGAVFSILSGPPKLHEEPVSVFSSVGYDLWLILFFSWIFVSIIYVIFTRIEIKMEYEVPWNQPSLVESLLTFYGLLFQRGFDNLPKTLCRRLLASGWLILVIVLMTEMSGCFSSSLAVQDVPERIDKIEDIIKYPNIRPNVPEGTAVDVSLKYSTNKDHQAVWNQILRHNSVRNWFDFYKPEMMEEIAQGRSVAIGFINAQLKTMVSIECQQRRRHYYIARESFLSSSYALMFRKGLDPKIMEIFNRMAVHFGGMGFHDEIMNEISKHSKPCLAIEFLKISYAPFVLRDLAQVFKILAMGTVIGTVVFIFEISVGVYQKAKG